MYIIRFILAIFGLAQMKTKRVATATIAPTHEQIHGEGLAG